jgi:hypothetical protein
MKTLSPISDFLNSETDYSSESKIKLVLDRKITGVTAWYRLENDGWFRRYMDPGKGFGLMIRDIRIGINRHWKSGVLDLVFYFPVVIKYLPYSDMENDSPEVYETAKGWIIYGNDSYESMKIFESLGPKELEMYIKMNIPNYIP